MPRRLLIASLALLGTLALHAQTPDRLIVTNVRLADTAAGRLRQIHALVIEGEKIAAILTDAGALPEGTRIDGGGATLLPPLTDLAIQAAPGLTLDADFYYAMSLAHGVMRVRTIEVRLPWGAEQRARIAAGEITGPRLWTAGPTLDMRTPFGSRLQPVTAAPLLPFTQVADAAGARREVRRQAGHGANWVRLGPHVPADVVRAAAMEARTANVKLSLHPWLTSISQAAQAGVTLVEGLGTPVRPPAEAAFTSDTGQEGGPSTGSRLQPGETDWSRVSAADQKAVIAALTKGRTALAPLLARSRAPEGPSGIGYLPKSVRELAQSRIASASNTPVPAGGEQGSAFVAALHAAGGRLVVASGSGADGWPLPGRGVHREMRLLAEAGVPPADVLRVATVTGAEVLGETTLQLRAGGPADFFAVAGDPLADLAALDRITLIVRRGELVDREDLLKRAGRAVGR